MLPFEFAARFKQQCDVDVENLLYHVCLPFAQHRGKGTGVHSFGYDQNWLRWLNMMLGKKCDAAAVEEELWNLITDTFVGQYSHGIPCKGGPSPIGWGGGMNPL